MARLNESDQELVKRIVNECKTPADVTGKLKELFAGTLEQMLEVELEEHLGYESTARWETIRETAGTAAEKRRSKASGARRK